MTKDLTVFVVYGPTTTDYPGRFVVRRRSIGRDGIRADARPLGLGMTLDEARRHIPTGLVRLGPRPQRSADYPGVLVMSDPADIRIMLVQCLCPSRHCIMAMIVDPRDHDPNAAATMLERKINDDIRDNKLNPWCGLCESRTGKSKSDGPSFARSRKPVRTWPDWSRRTLSHAIYSICNGENHELTPRRQGRPRAVNRARDHVEAPSRYMPRPVVTPRKSLLQGRYVDWYTNGFYSGHIRRYPSGFPIGGGPFITYR